MDVLTAVAENTKGASSRTRVAPCGWRYSRRNAAAHAPLASRHLGELRTLARPCIEEAGEEDRPRSLQADAADEHGQRRAEGEGAERTSNCHDRNTVPRGRPVNGYYGRKHEPATTLAALPEYAAWLGNRVHGEATHA